MIRLQVGVGSGGTLLIGKKNLHSVVRIAAQNVARDARALIRAKTASGRKYRGSGGSKQYRGYKAKAYTASAPGQAPASVTGTLARSIKVRPFKSGDGAAIRDSAFYALFLQGGASGGTAKGGGRRKNVYRKRGGKSVRVQTTGVRVLQPRPFLTTALDANTKRIGAQIEMALRGDIAWKTLKL